MTEKTNFERHEDQMEFSTEKPSVLEEAQAVPGLNVEATQPVIKQPENINEPLPNTGEGVHGENLSKVTPQPQWQAPPAPRPEKLSGLVAVDKANDREAQRSGEVSELYDLDRLYREREG